MLKVERILIIGGYGLAGSSIAQLLLDRTSLSVIIGGRDVEKANKMALHFNDLFPGNRVQSTCVDVSNITSVKSAVSQCDLVIDCIPISMGANAEIAQEAMNVEIDYINLNASKKEKDRLIMVFNTSNHPNLHLLTHCGIFPGLPSALVRLAASHFDKVNKVMIGMIGCGTEGSVHSLEEMISADIKTPYVYKNNSWQKASMSASKKIDFGPPFRIRKCYLCNLDELEDQPAELNIGELELYAAETNSFTMIILVLWNLLRLNKFQKGIELGAKLLSWGVRRFAKQPFGITLKMEAVGEIDRIHEQFDVYLYCNDVYKSTAISAVACIVQLIDGDIKMPGVSYMGHVVNVDRFIQDLERLGMSVNVR